MSEELPVAWAVEPKERVKALTEVSSGSVKINETIPVKRYFRSGVELERMAKVYEDEKNYEKAFFLYCKYTTLFVECLPKHPHYRAQDCATDRRAVRGKLVSIFERAEKIKSVLLSTYAQQYKQWVTVDNARREEEDRVRRAEEARKQAEEEARVKREMEERERELAAELEQIEKQLEETRTIATKAIITNPGVASKPSFNRQATYPNLMADPRLPPESKPVIPTSVAMTTPDVTMTTSPTPSVQPTVDRSTKPPSVDRTTKPHISTSDMFGDLMRDVTRRRIRVPTSLSDKFLSVCLDNTQNNVETCGILAAKLNDNSFTVTHVILPQQRGTPDSCQTLAEEQLFEYVDKLDLIIVGWIHTHPTQSAFLSSVDLHTHCSYQLLLKEAIAIVCAPKHQQTGIFSLTDPRGIDVISTCTQSGFHPHPSVPALFEDCKHVDLNPNLSAQIIDLR